MGICGAWATTAAPQVSRCCFAGPVVLRPVAQQVNLALPLADPKFPDVLLVGCPSPRTWLLILLTSPVLCLRRALWVTSREAAWGM